MFKDQGLLLEHWLILEVNNNSVIHKGNLFVRFRSGNSSSSLRQQRGWKKIRSETEVCGDEGPLHPLLQLQIKAVADDPLPYIPLHQQPEGWSSSKQLPLGSFGVVQKENLVSLELIKHPSGEQ